MAQHKSAAKRARQSIRKTAVNNRTKSAVKSHEKNLLKALEAKAVKEVEGLLREFTSKISKAAAKGVVSKEAASRKIARISKRVHAALTK